MSTLEGRENGSEGGEGAGEGRIQSKGDRGWTQGGELEELEELVAIDVAAIFTRGTD